ncbi:MAG: flagellar filament capping protein FliD [Proteobacteria bacterium]|nr:flagellar filament capping protein FliD [Pseudomonadota bacterium]
MTQSGGDGGLASLTYSPSGTGTQLTQLQAAQDAVIKVNGYTYNSASNVVTGALTGVTLNLVGTTASGVTTSLTVATDKSSAQSAVQTFVSSYNTLANALSQLSSYDATSGTAGPLLGDSVLNTFENQVNSIVDASVGSLKGGPFSTLAEIGIVANTDGSLSADSNKLNTAFTNNYATITQLFAGSDGVAVKLNNLLNEYTDPTTGVFAQQTKSLQGTLADIASQQTALNQRMQTLQTTLLAQYNAMDALVAQLKSTGSALQAQLGSIYYPGKASTAVP